jgi:hypothetical protein
MKYLEFVCLVCIISLLSCGQKNDQEDAAIRHDTATPTVKDKAADTINTGKAPHHYSNARFKDVVVKKTSDNQFHVTGKAQVFEAAFSWVVEDGHEELLSGHGMTDAGAPAFGNFSFDVAVKKKRSPSTLHLILFEASARDGSRQHELPVPLD